MTFNMTFKKNFMGSDGYFSNIKSSIHNSMDDFFFAIFVLSENATNSVGRFSIKKIKTDSSNDNIYLNQHKKLVFGKKVPSVLREKSQVLLNAKNVEELKVMFFLSKFVI